MDGKEKNDLLALARKAIKHRLDDTKLDLNDYEGFDDELGVFVSLHKKGSLRGCIGYPYPVMSLKEAVVSAAESAAFNDPRFPPLSRDELDDLGIEISVLTQPELLETESPEDYPENIRIGEDGLIIRQGARSGLLLPQVATNYGFSAEEFLNCVCEKAGLPSTTWRVKDSQILIFQAEIFSDEESEKRGD